MFILCVHNQGQTLRFVLRGKREVKAQRALFAGQPWRLHDGQSWVDGSHESWKVIRDADGPATVRLYGPDVEVVE